MPSAGRPLGLIVSTLRPRRCKVLQMKPRHASSSLTPGCILMPPLVWIKKQLAADDDETKPTALVLRPHFLSVVPMPEERIDHTNDAVERHPSLLLRPNVADGPTQAIGVMMLAAGNARRPSYARGGEIYPASSRNA